MTKQDILEFFNDINDVYNNPNKHDDLSKMLDMIAQQEPCGKDINVTATDAISRQAVLEIVERVLSKGDAQFEIEQLPSVNPQPKTGQWIETGAEELPFGVTLKELTCSECGWNSTLMIPRNYCPKCGAKMKGAKE